MDIHCNGQTTTPVSGLESLGGNLCPWTKFTQCHSRDCTFNYFQSPATTWCQVDMPWQASIPSFQIQTDPNPKSPSTISTSWRSPKSPNMLAFDSTLYPSSSLSINVQSVSFVTPCVMSIIGGQAHRLVSLCLWFLLVYRQCSSSFLIGKFSSISTSHMVPIISVSFLSPPTNPFCAMVEHEVLIMTMICLTWLYVTLFLLGILVVIFYSWVCIGICLHAWPIHYFPWSSEQEILWSQTNRYHRSVYWCRQDSHPLCQSTTRAWSI